MKYRQEIDGVWFRPQLRGWMMKCCDCGLTHKMNFRVKDGFLEIQAFRTDKKKRDLRGRYMESIHRSLQAAYDNLEVHFLYKSTEINAEEDVKKRIKMLSRVIAQNLMEVYK